MQDVLGLDNFKTGKDRYIRNAVVAPNTAQYRDLINNAKIPRRYWTIDPNHYNSYRGREYLDAAVKQHKTIMAKGLWLYIHGPFGTGKSTFAAWLALDAISRVESVAWVNVADVPGIMFNDSSVDPAWVRYVRNADYVVLDDLGSEGFGLHKAAGPALERFLRIFYDNQRTVVITSNVAWGSGMQQFDNVYSAVQGMVSVFKRVTVPLVVCK